jgi:hypothetical protein
VKAFSRGLDTQFFKPMSHLLLRSLTVLACFGIFGLPQTSAAPKPEQPDRPDFNGTWILDLKASTSLDPLMERIGASLFERKSAGSAKLKATIQQTEQVITVATRGPGGFALDETLYPDGRSHGTNLHLLGATCLAARTLGRRTIIILSSLIRSKPNREKRAN